MVSNSDRRSSNEVDKEAHGLEDLVRTRTLRASDVNSMHYCNILETQFSALEKAAFAWSRSIAQVDEETDGGFVMNQGVPERRGSRVSVPQPPTHMDVERDSPFYEPASPGDNSSYDSFPRPVTRSEDGGRAERSSEMGERDSTWEEESGLVEQDASLETRSGSGKRGVIDTSPTTEDEKVEVSSDSGEGTSDDEELPPSEVATSDEDLLPTEELEATYTPSDEDERSHSSHSITHDKSLEGHVDEHLDTRIYADEASSDASHISSEKENQPYPERTGERRLSTDPEYTENPLFRILSDDSDTSDASRVGPRQRRRSGQVFQRQTGSGRRLSSPGSSDVVVVSSLAHAKKVRRRFVESPAPTSVASHSRGNAARPARFARSSSAQDKDDEVLREITDIANGATRVALEANRSTHIAEGGSGLIGGVFADTGALHHSADRHKEARRDRKTGLTDDDVRNAPNNFDDKGLLERDGVQAYGAEAERVSTETVAEPTSAQSKIRKGADMVTPDRAAEEAGRKKLRSVSSHVESPPKMFRFELEKESLFDKYALLTGLSAEQLQDLYGACNEPEDTAVLDQILHFLLYKVRNPPDNITEIDQNLGEFFRAHIWFPFEDHLLLNNIHNKRMEKAKGSEAMKGRVEYLKNVYSSADAFSIDKALEKWPFSEFSIPQILYYKKK